MTNNAPKGRKIIRICWSKSQYDEALSTPAKFKEMLHQEILLYPELFPQDISTGYSLFGKTRASAKLEGIRFQRIQLKANGDVYNIYPSCVMPNLIAYTEDVEKALLLRKHSVPYSTLVLIFGKDEMFWYRAEKAFAKCSVVGTTVKKKTSCQ